MNVIIDNASTGSESEWQTTRSRQVTDKKSGYVPPHLRLKVSAPEKPTALSMDDDDAFPTLGSFPKTPVPMTPRTPMTPMTPSTPASFTWKKASFAQKINDLIALEQRTEAEREAALAIQRDMEGWITLPLKFDKAKYIYQFNEKICAGSYITSMVTNYVVQPPITYSTSCEDLDETCSVYSDDE